MSELEKVNLSFENFINRLKEEYKYQKDGGTSYRRETSRLSLEFASNFKKVTPFLDFAESKKLVSNHFSSLEPERIDDVGKMLHVIAKNLYVEHITSDEAKEYVRKMMKHKHEII